MSSPSVSSSLGSPVPAPEGAGEAPIRVVGARTHNLKGLSCEVPAGKMTVVTGLSGSGKSSLAFDTLFAEGQRRYVESLSTYARQFIARMPRPEVDQIDGIPPAIALEQKNAVRNARSTIGTATEINDYLRLLFAKIGRQHCPVTGGEVRGLSASAATAAVLAGHAGARATVVAPLRLREAAMLEPTLRELLRQGFTRLLRGDEVEEIEVGNLGAWAGAKELRVVVDRVVVRGEDRARVGEAMEAAYRVAEGRAEVVLRGGPTLRFTAEVRCAGCPGDCGQAFREPSPQLLNFSSPLGACVTCQGFGRVTGLDWGKVIPDPTLSLDQGAVAPWNGEAGQECLRDLRKQAKALGVRLNVPWEELSDEERRVVRDGVGKWYGIKGYFDWLEERRYKVQARVQIARYRGYTPCPDCGGTRLRPEALRVRVGGRSIGELCDMTVRQLAAWFEALALTPEESLVAERPLQEIRSRLRFLLEVGLGYLTLSRQTRTLSGGESQRINLSTALGSALTETLYVLDEPTVGLHARDTDRLAGILERLRDLGNTVVVVEHDPDVVRRADWILDVGPKAGEHGGELLFQGTVAALQANPGASRTAEYLFGTPGAPARREAPAPPAPRKGPRARAAAAPEAVARPRPRVPHRFLTIRGATENNLRNLTVRLPLDVFCCITGVSGSGKSTLIKSCLYQNYLRSVKADVNAEPGRVESVEGFDGVSDIVLVDQSPIGRSSRSNAATYLKAWEPIRTLLAGTPGAKAAELEARDFSFNVPGGRCEVCEGTGRQVIDMHFLADVEVLCEACEGNRFQDRVMEARWEGMNVSDILSMTVERACEVFAEFPRIVAGLEPLRRVGLGYLRLGQSTATLSGGEAQRLKLAGHLAEAGSRESRRLLLLFDEPTTGLHPADLDVLLGVFQDLVDQGISLIVIEHNIQLIRQADYVLDLGPEAGEDGGLLVAEGTPESIAEHPDSLTGRFLRETVLNH